VWNSDESGSWLKEESVRRLKNTGFGELGFVRDLGRMRRRVKELEIINIRIEQVLRLLDY
jgi:hypothetical protein